MNKFLRRISYLFNRRKLAEDLEQELFAHREMMSADRRSSFGSALKLREESQDAWGFTWLDHFRQDVAYGARQLRRSRGFTVAAVVILALGVGLNLAAFHVFNAVYFNHTGLRDADSLVRYWPARSSLLPAASVSFYRDHSTAFSYIASETASGTVLIEDDPVRSTFVSANYFVDLGILPAQGRLLDPRDADAGAPPVAVLGFRYWQSRLGSDTAVIGRTVRMNGNAVQIVGVTPSDFDGLSPRSTAIWLPLRARPYLIEGSPAANDFSRADTAMYAKLKPGFSAAAAQEQLRALTPELYKLRSDQIQPDDFLRGRSLRDSRRETSRRRPVTLFGALVLLILLSTCANLGNILLARGLARQQELHTRAALGAGRWRVIRQLMTENLLLAVLGSAAGLIAGFFAAKLFLHWLDDVPPDVRITTDWRVLLAGIALAIFSTFAFGLAPAMQAVRRGPQATRSRKILVAVQVAVSCVLLILSGLLTRSAQDLLEPHLSFDYARIVTLRPSVSNGQTGGARVRLEQLAARMEQLPGVDGVALAGRAPISDWSIYSLPGLPPMFTNYVDQSYFRVMNLPVVQGRTFLAAEQNAVIVSESAARVIWPNENPLGKSLPPFAGQKPTVVGVVKDSSASSIQDVSAVEVYLPLEGRPLSQALLLVHTRGDPSALLRDVRAAASEPGVTPDVSLLKTAMDRRVDEVRIAINIVGVLGATATLLAAFGIFGLVTFAVLQRTREIGLRLALGARPAHIMQTLVAQYTAALAIGGVAGAALAAACARAINHEFFGLKSFDPGTYAVAVAVFPLVVLSAVAIPARRALRIDPASALRWE